MHPYSYKDSGIEWLGDAPKHWKTQRLKSVISKSENGTWGKDAAEDENDVICVRAADFDTDQMLVAATNLVIRNISEPHLTQKTIGRHDLLIEKSGGGDQVPVGRVVSYNGEQRAVFSNFLGIIGLHNYKADSTYMKYYFSMLYNSKLVWKSIKQTTGLQNLDTKKYFTEQIPLPPLPEQEAIAAYLEKACARIDRVIAIKEEQLRKLALIRRSKIYQAVTAGIEGSVPRKKTEIGSVREIPTHWKIKRIKMIGNVRYGLGQPPNEMVGGLPIIRATNVYRGKIDTSKLIFVDPDDIPYERDPVLKKDDIIVVRSGAYTADSAIIPEEFEGAITGYDMVLRCYGYISAKFVSYALLSTYILEEQLLQLSMRAAQPHLNREQLGNTKIVMPEFDEQERIAKQLDLTTAKIDQTLANIKQQIATLKSYRKSLIHECVTGKKQVAEMVKEKEDKTLHA